MNRLALLATIGILVSVGGAGARSVLPTGLTGKVLRGPTMPVCQADIPCYAPFKGTLVFTRITTSVGTFAPARTQTEHDGHYRVLLDPARYRVTLPTTSRWRGTVKPSVVTVSKGVMRRVNLVVDTGIR